MFARLFDSPVQLLILVLVIVVVVGWKRLPDVARSLGKSMRIFKTEVDEMKKDGKSTPSAASSDTVKGETVDRTAHPTVGPASDTVPNPAANEKQNQPPA